MSEYNMQTLEPFELPLEENFYDHKGQNIYEGNMKPKKKNPKRKCCKKRQKRLMNKMKVK